MSKIQVNHGPEWFQKAFKQRSHKDDWGVPCMYDYMVWRMCKIAIAHDRKKRSAGGRP